MLLGAGGYVGWNIGANDPANCVGTSLGCGLTSFKKAVILIALFAILGAVLQGHHVMHTIGKGIVKEDLNLVAVLVALICSGFIVSLATFFKILPSSFNTPSGGRPYSQVAMSPIQWGQTMQEMQWALLPILELVTLKSTF